MITLEKIEELKDDYENVSNDYLRLKGWNYTSSTPPHIWLWEKKLCDGRTVLVDRDTAFNIQSCINTATDPARKTIKEIANEWVSVEDELPSRHTHIWCLNRNGYQFEGCICYGMHKPFFTYPRGDGNPSNTNPSWIDVTHWKPLPEKPKE